jgi:hypothetical protein
MSNDAAVIVTNIFFAVGILTLAMFLGYVGRKIYNNNFDDISDSTKKSLMDLCFFGNIMLLGSACAAFAVYSVSASIVFNFLITFFVVFVSWLMYKYRKCSGVELNRMMFGYFSLNLISMFAVSSTISS